MSLYTARIPYPMYYQREADNTTELAIYKDGSPASLSSGTLTVKDNSGDEIVGAAVVTISGGVASYLVTAATLPDTLDFSNDWIEVWALVIDGKTYTFNRPAGLARTLLYPVITDLDLLDEFTELRRWQAEDKSDLTNYIEAAWRDIMNRLTQDGRRPYLILSPYSLRDAHMRLSASKAFRDAASSATRDGKYWKLYEAELKEYHKAWDRMTLRYDQDEDGLLNEDAEESSAPAQFLTEQPGQWWPY